MKLDSLTFVYFFLPLAVALFYCTPNRIKKPVLLIISLAFCALAEPRYLLLLIASVAYDYAFVQLMESFDDSPAMRRFCLGMVAGKVVILLIHLGKEVRFAHYLLPLGLMVSFLNALGYTIEIYYRKNPYERNFIDFFLFTSFFAALPCGPLVRYEELMPQLKKFRPSLTSISKGVVLFVIGLAKKVLLGDSLLQVYQGLHNLYSYEPTPPVAFALVLSLALTVFFLFSAYSDMARGVGRIFSLEYPRNFYYPYQAKTVREWLERFNSTYYEFCQRNLSLLFPLQEGKAPWQEGITLLLCGLLAGAWFGFTPGFLLWGFILGGFAFLEHTVYEKQLFFLPPILRRGYTFCVMLFAFTAFTNDGWSSFVTMLGWMLGLFSYEAGSAELLYLLSANAGAILLGLLLSTSVLDLAGAFFRKHFPAFSDGMAVCFNLMLLLVTTAFMIG